MRNLPCHPCRQWVDWQWSHSLLCGSQAGKCFDVGEDVFSDDHNLGDQTQQWASLVVSQLKAGNATVCGTTTTDHKIATAGILGF